MVIFSLFAHFYLSHFYDRQALLGALSLLLILIHRSAGTQFSFVREAEVCLLPLMENLPTCCAIFITKEYCAAYLTLAAVLVYFT